MRPLRIAHHALVAAALASLGSGLLSAAPAQERAASPGASNSGAGAPTPEAPAAGIAPAETDIQGEEPWSPRTPLELELCQTYSDWHFAVVGDEILTQQDIRRAMQGLEDPALSPASNLSPEELLGRQVMEGAVALTTEELKVQGGQNQGFDPELIQRALASEFSRQVASRGGPVAFSDVLSRSGADADSFRQVLRRRLLGQLWTDAVTGRSAGATGRVYVDSYVRPASLYRRYRELLARPNARDAEEIGRQPAMVSMRRLVISSQQERSEQRALELAEACRLALLNNTATFDDLVNQYAPEGLKGDLSRLDITQLQAARMLGDLHPGPSSAEFLASAAPGDLSPVLGYMGAQGEVYFALYRLEGRAEATEATPFGDLELQSTLRQALLEENRDLNVRRGVSELARTTCVSDRQLKDLLIRTGGPR